jgi:hypothetical protein
MADFTISGSQKVHTPSITATNVTNPVPSIPANPSYGASGNTALTKSEQNNWQQNPVPHLQ